MKVKELIAALQKLDQESQIGIMDCMTGWINEAHDKLGVVPASEINPEFGYDRDVVVLAFNDVVLNAFDERYDAPTEIHSDDVQWQDENTAEGPNNG